MKASKRKMATWWLSGWNRKLESSESRYVLARFMQANLWHSLTEKLSQQTAVGGQHEGQLKSINQ